MIQLISGQMHWTENSWSANGQEIHEEIFNILSHKEMQIRVILKLYLNQVRVAIIMKTNDNNVSKDSEKRKPCNSHNSGNYKLIQSLWKSV
jgi:hypothetical protein